MPEPSLRHTRLHALDPAPPSVGTCVGGSSYAGPLLKDFGPGDKIDLHNFGSIASMLYDSNTGLLYVGRSSNQFATLDVQNTTRGTGAGFTSTSDGKGGVLLMHG